MSKNYQHIDWKNNLFQEKNEVTYPFFISNDFIDCSDSIRIFKNFIWRLWKNRFFDKKLEKNIFHNNNAKKSLLFLTKN